MNEQKRGLRQRTYYYVQPADNKTNNLLITALEDPVLRSPKEAVGAPIPSSHYLYLVPWSDVEHFMKVGYAAFSVFFRKAKESLPRFGMRKSKEMEDRNSQKERPSGGSLSIVKKAPAVKKETTPVPLPAEEEPQKSFPENQELAQKNAERLEKVRRPEKRTLIVLSPKKKTEKPKLKLVCAKTAPKIKWATYVIIPRKDSSFNITTDYIRKSLLEAGLNTQSVYEKGKLNKEAFEYVWEANGDALFRLWRYARQNTLIHFTVFRSSKDGLFKNFERVFYYPKG